MEPFAIPSRPSVSVLMPCLNPGTYLDEAIASCLAQPELSQLLIADGGSHPATLEQLEAWAQRDRRLTWWSAADQGPADALQRALARAEGELIGWLNADDRYELGALQRAVKALEEQPLLQMVYGHGQHIDAGGAFLELYPSRRPEVGIEAFQDGCFICQPTVLLRRSFVEQLGGFDPKWRVCFDLDLWLRAFATSPEAIGFVPALQASTRLHAATLTAQQQWRVNLESAALLHRACGHVEDDWLHSAARELLVQQGAGDAGARLMPAAAVLEQPTLIAAFEAAVLQLQRSSGELLALCTLPADLQLLLQSRPDLLACGFHLPDQQQAFAQWLLLHGLREYPPLAEGAAACNPVLAWLAQAPQAGVVPRITQAIWDSAARHRRRWPLPRKASAYQRWLRRHWTALPLQDLPSYTAFFGVSRRQRWMRRLLFRQVPSLSPGASVLRPGVNLIGYASHALGIGEDLRTTAQALDQVDVAHTLIDFPPRDFPGRELSEPSIEGARVAPHQATILCLTAEETVRYVLSRGRAFLRDRYVIGYWPWELPRWPQPWRSALDLVDEIWVSSRHIQSGLQAETTKPVQLMPLCVDASFLLLAPPTDGQRQQQRRDFDLPAAAVLALCSFDLSSHSQRKNPWGAIQAFQRAFPPILAGGCRWDVALVVKTFPPAHPHPDWQRLKRVAALDPRIHILEANLSRAQLSSLYGCCDVLLSLHRAEGFGRVLAETLQLGLDVIATDWSGNTDFCDGPLAHPVPFSLVPVPPGAYPHWPDQHWAEPDTAAAAALLEQVAQRRLLQGRPAAELSEPYRQRFSASSCGLQYRQRLEQLALLSAPAEPRCAAPGSSPLPQG